MTLIRSIVFIFIFLLYTNQSLSAKESYSLVKADNWLNLRAEPNLKASIVKKLAKGSPVKELDGNYTETILSGKKGKWIEVEYFTTKGWLFDLYITKADENNPLLSYLMFLKKLDSSNTSSLKSARDQYLKMFPTNSKDAENAFRLLREFTQEVIPNIREQYYSNLMNEYGNTQSPELIQLKNHGINVSYCEGDLELIENFSYYKNLLKAYQFPLKKTIDIYENAAGYYACDAGINISWDEMHRRITLIEDFLKKQPKSPENSDLESYWNNLMSDYALGMDNTPVCDFQDNTVIKEILQSFQKFEKQNTKSKHYAFFIKYFGMLKSNKYKCNDKIKQFAYSYFNPN